MTSFQLESDFIPVIEGKTTKELIDAAFQPLKCGFDALRLRDFVMALSLFLGTPASAEVIQVSLGDSVGSSLQGPAGGPSAQWNDWRTMDGGLKNSAGGLTPVTFAADGAGPHGDWWCDLGLLEGGIHSAPGVTSPFVISGLVPLKTYDLYIASSWGSKQGNTSFQTANPSNTPSPQFAINPSAGNATTWVRGTNFVFFQDLKADASGRISLSYQGVAADGILNGFQLVGPIEVPTTTFQVWAEDPVQGFTTASNDGPLDDPDQDGIVNLLEFSLGSAPLVPSRINLPQLNSVAGKWIFDYDRSDAARPPYTSHVVEYSSDLRTWTPLTVPVISGRGVTILDNGPTDRVQVTLPSSAGAMFARLGVSVLTPYDVWAASSVHGLTPGVNDGLLVDPDGDGLVNFLEFVLQGAPMVPSPQNFPVVSQSGNQLLFEYGRSDLSLPPATTQIVEYSVDLIHWTPVTIPASSQGIVTITDTGPIDRVKVTIPIPVEGSGMFARLKATR